MTTHAAVTSIEDRKSFSFGNVIRALWFFLMEYRKRYVVWNIIIFLAHFFALVPPLILGRVVDFFTAYRPGDSLFIFILHYLERSMFLLLLLDFPLRAFWAA